MQQENDEVQSEMQNDWTTGEYDEEWSSIQMTVRIDSCRGNTK